MKRWENGEYIELSETEKAELEARRAEAEIEERIVAERSAVRQAKLMAFREKAKSGRVTLADLADAVLALMGE